MSVCEPTSGKVVRSDNFAPTLLRPSEPDPVECLNPNGTGHFVLGCEHAGNLIPANLGTLGLTEAELKRHIAWDIGAHRLTSLLSKRLDCTAVLQRYSRLVYDCNRTVAHPGAFVTEADGSLVIGNEGLADDEKTLREDEIYRPFHRALTEHLEARMGGPSFAFVAIHSFNETLRGQRRPWQIGFIYNQHSALSKNLIQWFRANTDHVVGDNAPYSPKEAVDHTFRVQAEARAIPCTMIEVRNDLLQSEEGIAYWANRIAAALLATSDK